jgi:hypothetical protein
MKAANIIPGMKKKTPVKVANARNYGKWSNVPKHQ